MYKRQIIRREQKNFYRNCPCRTCPKGRCEGFTVRTLAIKEAIRLGANILKVNFKASNKSDKLDTYVISLNDFIKSGITQDNEKFPQYSCPIHKFLKVEP